MSGRYECRIVSSFAEEIVSTRQNYSITCRVVRIDGNLPAIGKKIAYKTNRDGVAERFADPAVQQSIAVDLALITSYDELLRDVELTIVKTAKPHDAHTLYLLPTVPGIGKSLSLVLRYEIHQID